MSESILVSVKKVLGLDEGYEAFDPDILLHINSVFGTLTQLGIGPAEGFYVEDKDVEWSEFLGDDLRFISVKTYVYLRVRLLFDPPNTGYLVTALQEQITQMEWRLNVVREETEWIDPDPILVLES